MVEIQFNNVVFPEPPAPIIAAKYTYTFESKIFRKKEKLHFKFYIEKMDGFPYNKFR